MSLVDRNYHFEDKEILDAIVGTDYLKGKIEHHLHILTSGEKWSLYRAIAKLIEEHTIAINVSTQSELDKLHAAFARSIEARSKGL